jgi:hypothetical protein
MSLLSPSVRLLGVVLVSAIAVAACSSSNDTTSPDVDLSGSYTLSKFQQPPAPELQPPIVTGTLVMTATRYKVVLNLPQTAQVVDSGTYTATSTTLTQSSDGFFGQSTGTYTKSGSTLVTDLTSAGQRILSTWTKQ